MHKLGRKQLTLALQQGARLGAEHHALRGAQPGAPVDPIVDETRAAFLARTRRRGDAHGVARDLLRDGHLARQRLEPLQILAGEQRLDGVRRRRGGLEHDGDLVVLREVVDHDVEHEAVQLRLGQGIGAFQLNRVFRG